MYQRSEATFDEEAGTAPPRTCEQPGRPCALRTVHEAACTDKENRCRGESPGNGADPVRCEQVRPTVEGDTTGQQDHCDDDRGRKHPVSPAR